jgi:hypothetical protein
LLATGTQRDKTAYVLSLFLFSLFDAPRVTPQRQVAFFLPTAQKDSGEEFWEFGREKVGARDKKKSFSKKLRSTECLLRKSLFKMGAAKRSPSFLKKVSPIRNVMSRDDAQTVT